ncbi:MAG: nucleotide exchange factor GrpE [Acidobacteria bacterium]|nr:nucleotide exchange factor GrpE [Acidobacteriota bacterium]MCW5967752.1 nucleotide exchange factor GrpE [Blastocatellales bacterium]
MTIADGGNPETRTGESEVQSAADTVESAEGSQAASDELQELKEKLMEAENRRLEAERQVADYADRFRKAQAQLRQENDEVRARLHRNFEQKIETARGDIIAGLLDTLDNLKRAVAVAEASEQRESDFEALLGGVRATAEMFETRMKALGLAAIESEGEAFNPELHEAVEIVEVGPELDHRVVSELQPGYKFGDRLLRPARVRVGRAQER